MKTKASISPVNNHPRAPSAAQKQPPADRRIRIRPTRYGNTFLFILLAMLVGSLNSNNNLGFLLTFMLGSMAAVSIFHTRHNLAGIQLAHMRARPVFAGEPANFEIRLRKTGHRAYAIRTTLSGEDPVTVDLANGAPVTITITMATRKRGLLAPGPLEIFTQYPFGLFQARTARPHSASCLVYPRPIAGPVTTVPGDITTGVESARTGPGVDDFVGLKTYQPGDNLGQISWKAYSRGQGLLTKEFSGESGRMLTIDWYALNEPDLERKLSRLCGMLLHTHKTGLHFGLRLPDRTIAPARGENHLKTCLTSLALFGLPGDVAGTWEAP
jgi:uncharacterized protein (DUF58 family)